MKKLNKHLCTVLFIMFTALNAWAQPMVTVDTDKGTVSIIGTSTKKKVSIIIINSEASLNELDSGKASFADVGIYADSTDIKYGDYRFRNIKINSDAPFGDYSCRVTDGINYEDIKFPYASTVQILEILNAEASDKNAEALMWCVKSFKDKLSLDTEIYNTFDEEGKKELCRDYLLGSTYTIHNFGIKFEENIQLYFEKRKNDALLELTKADTREKVKKCIDKYNDIYELDFNDSKWLGALKAEEISEIYSRLALESFSLIEDVSEKCNEKIALYLIEKGPWGNVEAMLDEYKAMLNLDLTTFNSLSSSAKDGVCKKIKGAFAENGKKLQDIINAAVDEVEKPSRDSGGGIRSGSGNGFLAIAAAKENIAQADTVEKESFSDLSETPWAKEAIESLYKKGIINGNNGKFKPNDNVTRAELVKILKQAFDITGENSISYTDVGEKHWAYPYVTAASEIINGYGNGIFGAEDFVTREDAAVFIYRALKLKGITINQGDFKIFADKEAVSDYAEQAVNILSSAGIITGISEGRFAPKDYTSRAQTAIMIYRIIGN